MFKIYSIHWWGDTEYYANKGLAMVRLEQIYSVIEPENEALMDAGLEPKMPSMFEEEVIESKDEIKPIVFD